MPPAKIWTGTLSFVLVSIPIELVSAVRRDRVSFRQMHRDDNALLQRRMYCPQDETFVHPEHIVNGYEVGEDTYVVVRQEEYKALEPKRSQTIEISAFVEADQIDPVYIDRPYYILPRKGGSKAYQMLRRVMDSSRKVGLAKFVLHTREHLVAVRANAHLLEMTTLHFHAQIRPADEIIPEQKPQSAKFKSIAAAMKKEQGTYQPQRYSDVYHKQVLEFLEQKVQAGHTVTIEPPEEEQEAAEPASQADLIAVLEESLAKVKH